MRTARVRGATASALLTLVTACATQPTALGPDGEWAGSITTEGGVTLVVNESGSVWDGKATLVEEASIGVEAGPDEYMFGDVISVFGTDEHIHVVDEQTNLARRYDHDGVFVDVIGALGQGPGEYMDPGTVAVDPQGNILVYDFEAERTQIYDQHGESLGFWPSPTFLWGEGRILFDAGGGVWFPAARRDPETGEFVQGIQRAGAEGPNGEIFAVPAVDVEGTRIPLGRVSMRVPFSAQFTWAPHGAASTVSGISNRYRFEIRKHGTPTLVIEKWGEPLAIPPERAEWSRQAAIVSYRRSDPEWSWDGDEIPSHYPAFQYLMPNTDGTIWVARQGPALRLPDCLENPLAASGGPEPVRPYDSPCWRDVLIVDAFDRDGRFLGEIDVPDDMVITPAILHVVGDRVIGVATDELDTPMVKRYRLVLPDEG